MEIGKNIERARRKAGWSQSELGKAIGLYQGRISAFERDAAYPTLPQLISIADATGATFDELLRGETRVSAETIHPTIVDLLSRMDVAEAIRRLAQIETGVVGEPGSNPETRRRVDFSA